jgi:hypothetical protein
MKFPHPEGTATIIAIAGTQLLGEVTRYIETTGNWITIGYIGSSDKIMIECDEWPAFKALVAEIDEALK